LLICVGARRPDHRQLHRTLRRVELFTKVAD
jgi:hypothetical protein